MATFTGTTGNDVANAQTGTLTGYTGGTLAQLQDASGDTFNSAGGADTVVAGNGDDAFRGLAGNDSFDGRGGFDEIRYDADATNGGTAGVTVNLATGTATDGFGGTDTFSNVEQVRGTNSSDTLTGGNTANGTGVGVTAVDGFEGFRGLGGNDTINGGGGFDEVRYDADAANGGGAGVTVNLVTGVAIDGFGATDTLIGIEGARGTAFADTFIGHQFDNTFSGLSGADTITGGDGFDTVRYDNDAGNGGAAGITANLAAGFAVDGFGFTDTLSGIQGVRGTMQADTFVGSDFVGFYGDQFQGLGGNDSVNGGQGNDEVRYDNDEDFGGNLGVTVNLATGTATDGFGNSDILTGIENVRGTSHVDTITGNDGRNVLRGLAGNDTLNGGLGVDVVSYEFDTFNGGTGGVTVNLVTQQATDGFGNTDTLSGIEGARGTNQADTFTGDGADNMFSGFGGNDSISGGAGLEDEVRYDVDEIRGGGGAVNVNLASGTATDGYGNTDTLSGIEAVRGTRFNDTFTGGGADEYFRGLQGNDSINGGGGSDWVIYSADIFNRQESQTVGAVTVNLAAGTATDSFGGIDTLTSIENASGGHLADALTGDGNANTFRGFAGFDIITGASGSDTVDYSRDAEFGADHFLFGLYGAYVNLVANYALDGFGNTDTLSGIENATGTANSDVFVGDASANTFRGGASFDNFYGGDGGDTLHGESGDDVLAGDAGNDFLYGGDGGDILSELAGGAASGNDTLDGGNGVDIMYAGDGDDTVIGGTDALNNYGNLGAGADSYVGSNGTDVVQGGAGSDTITGGDGDDSLYGEADSDTIYGGSGIDLLSGSTGNDTLDGGANNDLLVGDEGNDTLLGDAGIDVLYGFANDDILNGGTGGEVDALYGGAGNDSFQVGGAGYGLDYIYDFVGGAGASDRILVATGVTIASQGASGGNYNITFSNGSQVRVVGVTSVLVEDIVLNGF